MRRDSARDQNLVGETANLAARLQTVASPGDSGDLRQNARCWRAGTLNTVDLGRRELKGWPEPVSAWQVIRASQVESHFEARHESSLAPLIGRDEEVELLLRRWKQATDGEGRVVVVTGRARHRQVASGARAATAARRHRACGAALVLF